MCKVLVTGGAGFIGSHLVDRLLAADFEVTVIDNLSTGNLGNLPTSKRVNLVKGDIRDFQCVKEAMKGAEVVFHLAAIASVSLSMANPHLTNEVNVVGTLNVLEAVGSLEVKKSIFASSAAVYGLSGPPLKSEEMKLNPMSPYGMSKLAGEQYVRIYNELYGLKTLSLRFFNVYGRRQTSPDATPHGVISLFLDRLRRNLPLHVYGDGTQKRDFVHVHDVVEASVLAMRNDNISGEALNIGTGIGTSVNEVVHILQETTGVHLPPLYVPPRSKSDILDGYADITKARRLLGFQPSITLRDGVQQLIA